MSLSRILELRQQRAALVERAGSMLTQAHKAGTVLTAEQQATFQALHDDADKLLQTVQTLERERKAGNRPENLRGDGRTTVGERRNRVLRAAILGGACAAALTPTDLRMARAMGVNVEQHGGKANLVLRLATDTHRPKTLAEARRRLEQAEQRAMHSGTGPAGGYATPEGFMASVEVAMLSFGGMREVATIMRTATGNPLPMPTTNDTSNEGELVPDDGSVAASEGDLELGQQTLGAFTFSTKMVKVHNSLLQDEAVNLEQLIGERLGERAARVQNRYFTTGNGVGAPTGAVTASVLGKTAASSTALTRNELVDLKHSVDPAYRNGARWMFADSTLAAIKKLVDGDGRPLWQAGIGEGEPDRIDGDPYVVNQHMAAMAAAAKSVLYGQLSKYLIRDVLDVSILVLRERFAEYNQVAFLGFFRSDGDLLDAGTNPVKHLLHP